MWKNVLRICIFFYIFLGERETITFLSAFIADDNLSEPEEILNGFEFTEKLLHSTTVLERFVFEEK